MKRLALIALLTAAAATPAVAGPPWITIEIRPMGSTFLLAHTFHHGTPMPLPLSGTAYGLVNGQRRTVPLRFDTTGEANGFAVEKSWASDGVWVLSIVIADSEHGGAGTVVGIDRTGSAAFVRFPRGVQGQSRAATSGEIDALLRMLDGQQPPALGHAGFAGILRLVAPALILAAVAVVGLRFAAMLLSARTASAVATSLI